MVQQLIKIEPTVTNIGADGWSETWADANVYNLIYGRLVFDYRKTNPRDGYNQEIWLIEGTQENIDAFVASDPKIVKLTSAEA